MEKYYYEVNQWHGCLEPCKVLNDDTKIGSVACQMCKFSGGVEETRDKQSPGWIKCSRIKEAVGDEKSKVTMFVEKWGQSHEEICSNLGYDVDTSDDILMLDYFYNTLSKVWIPKISSLYTREEQRIADKLRL